MRSHAITFIVLLAMLGINEPTVEARTWEDGIPAIIDGQMAYRYFLPADYDPAQEYPLVLSLHGAGQSGFNNRDQVAFHIGPLIDKTETEFPAILVAPQLPSSSSWGPGNSDDRSDQILDLLISDFSVDTDRLYVTGLSLGGFGSMEYLHAFNHERPEGLKVAAAAPLSGAMLEQAAIETIDEIPIWMVHGRADSVVSPDTSRHTFLRLADMGLNVPIPFSEISLGGQTAIDENVRYTELNGGHGPWSPIYADDALYDWMFAQSLPEPHSAVLCIFGGLVLFAVWRKSR